MMSKTMEQLLTRSAKMLDISKKIKGKADDRLGYCVVHHVFLFFFNPFIFLPHSSATPEVWSTS